MWGLLLSAALMAAHANPGLDFPQALAKAKKGEWRQPGVVEVEGFAHGRFQNFQFFLSRVGIRDGKDQVTLDDKTLHRVFQLLEKEGFAQMPERFGGKPRPTNRPEVRAFVRVRLGSLEKSVTQMRDGEQSKAFAKLVGKLLDLAQGLPAGLSAPPGWQALQWVLEGKLAPETLACEVALETKPKVFTTFSLMGGWYNLAFGDGQVHEGWLAGEEVRHLAKLLLGLSGPETVLRFPWERQVQVRARVLGQGVQAVGMAWSQTAGEKEKALAQRWAEVEEPLRVYLKELLPR
jgi:hypothetical protein